MTFLFRTNFTLKENVDWFTVTLIMIRKILLPMRKDIYLLFY